MNLVLVPYPKKICFNPGVLRISDRAYISIPFEEKEGIFDTAVRIKKVVKETTKASLSIIVEKRQTVRSAIVFKKDDALAKEGYKLSINHEGIFISYNEAAGAFHAVSTLKQILLQKGRNLPFTEITDEPDLPVRGISFDISRNKIPTMETLYKLVDFITDLKLNQLQLYIEGFSFAYTSFPEVWKDNTPVTGEEIMELDRYCRERFVELVPVQNSFGHMASWLSRSEFNHMAECPKGFQAPWGRYEKPATLDPQDPRSLEFLDTLYNDLLPYFNSDIFNICFDETFELGMGKSRKICEQTGTGRVYMDFLLKVCDLVRKHGKKPQISNDIILQHPELIPELPEDAVILEWGYESIHPFPEECEKFFNAGIPFYIFPGTSSWNTLTGRTENMKENILKAAENAKKYNGIGYLITDWGDYGHWQHLPVSYPGFVYGAAVCWGLEQNRDTDIASYLDNFIYNDKNKVMGKFALDIGNYYLLEKKYVHNNTNIVKILYADVTDTSPIDEMNLSRFEEIERYVSNLLGVLDKTDMRCSDGALIEAEYRNAVGFVLHGAKLGKLKLALKERGDKAILKRDIEYLIEDIEGLIGEYKRLWLGRNRLSELFESIKGMEKLKTQYKELLS